MSLNILSLIPKVIIAVDGTPIFNYKHLSIVQKMYDHHTFKIVVAHQIMDSVGSQTLDKSKWLGKLATIFMGDNSFIGIVTSVNMAYNSGHFGDLIISGFSKTILLESGPHLFSWVNRAFRDVISEVGAYASGDLEVINEPKFSGTVNYMVQYKESNFAFLRRMACQYNEWFYYDGDNLLFGEPSQIPTYSLVYGVDTQNVQVSSSIKPVQYGGFTYQSMTNQQMLGATQDTVKGLDEIGAIALKASTDLFNFYPLISSDPRVPDKESLDNVLKNLQAAAAANLSTVSGSSTQRSLRPGVIIDFKYKIGQPFGKYLVTSVHHTSTDQFNYLNHFEAVPAGIKVLPEPNIPNPIAYPEIAIVKSNDDPENKGRVMVQTQWQGAQDLATNWVRVMTPDAGHSGKVGANRGFMSIPEVHDQVILGYRYGDPNRPFVMGSLYHGLNGAGGDANNKMKSITTKSGSTIEFNDDDGSVLLSDHGSANTFIDGAGNYTTNAAVTANINVGGKENEPPTSFLIMDHNGNITIDGKESIVLQVGTNAIIIDSTGIHISSECGDITCSAGNLIDIASPKNHIAGETKLDEGDVFIN